MSSDNQQPEVMSGESLDISEQRKRELKQLFPGVFTETTGANGQPVETIDFERLKAELGTFSDVYENRRERYGMEWPGKRDCMRLIQEPSRATLKPCREESVDFDTTQNLFIEGDNLEVLKLLQKSYYGKVKMIYIDPPYNTGNEFIYPDKFSESLETYLAYAGLVDDEGKKFSTNTSAEGRFHTKWLNMMYPRLYLARNLLRNDGVVFISIDDNELVNIKKVCDELFGEENFVSLMVWKNKTGGGAKTKGWIGLHEYVLCYARDLSLIDDFSIPYSEKTASMYNKKDEHYATRGPYATWPLDTTSMGDRPNLRYPIIYKGKEIWPAKQWLWSKERVMEAQANNMLLFNEQKDGGVKVRFKGYLRDENGVMRRGKPLSIMDGPYTQEGSKDFQKLLPKEIFPFPKPVNLISQLISVSTSDGKNDGEDIILDFFSGSCTTAEAAFSYNLENGTSKKFILVQLPELCAEDSSAAKEGFKTISDVGKERIRLSAKRIRGEYESRLDLDDVGEIDLGFKVLKLDTSNFKQWQYSSEEQNAEQLIKQLDIHVDYVDNYATQEEILYELLIKAGFKPTEKIETVDLAGKQVFSIADSALLICLEDELNSELIDAVADKEPMQFICLDKGFQGNDQLKANAVQTFKSRSQNSETEMVFKVV